MDMELEIRGAIVDSWVEPAGRIQKAKRVVLQVASRGGRPGELTTVEASTTLVPDQGWLEDLGENLCHGSPISAVCLRTDSGLLAAQSLKLAR